MIEVNKRVFDMVGTEISDVASRVERIATVFYYSPTISDLLPITH
jgi:hypothetical protein